MERIKQILQGYTSNDLQKFKDTVDMLYTKGIANGVYQDYTILMDVIKILSICESIIKEGNNKCH